MMHIFEFLRIILQLKENKRNGLGNNLQKEILVTKINLAIQWSFIFFCQVPDIQQDVICIAIYCILFSVYVLK